MDKTAIQATVPRAGLPGDVVEPSRRPAESLILRCFKIAASLRVTVILFALSILLVFFGTLAQVGAGTWTAVSLYFRSAYVWVPFQIFFSPTVPVSGGFPFPGGWLLGGLLLVNLLAAHAVRFKISLKRSGILLIHSGLIILMLSELITGLFAVESRMAIETGHSSNYVEDYRQAELAVISRVDARIDDITVVPGDLLQQKRLIQHPDLPFDIEVHDYLSNSRPVRRMADSNSPATRGLGLRIDVKKSAESAGTDSDQAVDVPSAFVTFKNKMAGQSLGTYLVSVWLKKPQKVVIGDKEYQVVLRFKRTYKPYTLHLLEFHHDVYEGTQIPKDYTSRIQLIDPERGEDREVLIYMNHPLTYRNETFYQSSVLPGGSGTILQVVRNPGDMLPYISCLMVAVGMLIHFGISLTRFLEKRLAI
jgi:ResB-like family protein